MRGGGGACEVTVFAGDDLGDGIGGEFAIADFDEGACDDADHIIEIGIGVDFDGYGVLLGGDGEGIYSADAVFSLVAAGGKAGEIVSADH